MEDCIMASLNRWDPFTEIARLQDEMSRHFATGDRRAASFAPAVDIFEDKDAIFVKAELPGLKAEEVDIHVENDVLTISGERKLEKKDESAGYHRIERTYGSFTRSFSLPKNVAADQVEAEMTDGVLTVKLPKKAEAQPKKIAVKAGGSMNVKAGKA
jgi:HSP20 family protein